MEFHYFSLVFFSHIRRYLDDNNLLDALPLEQWYGTCFAGVLTNQSIIRIWDKICGGSRKIVVFVFVTIFNSIWRTTKLSSATQVSEILTIIDNVSMLANEIKSKFPINFYTFLSFFGFLSKMQQLKDNQESADHIVNNSIELWQKKRSSFEF